MYLNKIQKNLAHKYFGTSRYFFNKTVEYLKKPDTKASFYEVRDLSKTWELPEWATQVPARIRDFAVEEACNAVKNAKRKYKSTNKFQEVGFRSKKDKKQGFKFEPKSANGLGVFSKKYRLELKYSEKLPENYTETGGTLVCENGRYFIVIPEKIQQKRPENQRLGFVAIDPGIRSFISFFSPNCCGHIGKGDFQRIARLCRWVDKGISKMSKLSGSRKLRLSRSIDKQRWKIKDLISEIHNKSAHFFAVNFDVIHIPTFEVSQMVLKTRRKLRSKTARAMLTWSHFEFRQKLKSVAEKFSAEVVEVTEEYTSKTCSFCGHIDEKLGGKEMFSCKCCGSKVNRDLNASRGIFLKTMPATAFEFTIHSKFNEIPIT